MCAPPFHVHSQSQLCILPHPPAWLSGIQGWFCLETASSSCILALWRGLWSTKLETICSISLVCCQLRNSRNCNLIMLKKTWVFSYFEPCDCWDWITNNIQEEESVVTLCCGNFVCGLHIFRLLSLCGQRRRGLVPVLENILTFKRRTTK